jgi:GNAT superfamily N-acetyltransferase
VTLLEISEEPSLGDAETRLIHDGLLATDPTGQARGYAPLVVTLRDADGRLAGGVLAATLWGWLVVDALWVEDRLRRRGHGRALVMEAERLARGRGCTRARLDTFDFQARGFYERLGYDVYAELDDFPPGHTQFHLWKTLSKPD